MPKAKASGKEREFRSRITQLVQLHPLLRGSLQLRSRKCGKASCKCAQGELHTSLYLVQSQSGKYRQLFIPKQLEEKARQAVTDYQAMQQLIEELSELEWQRLKDRQE